MSSVRHKNKSRRNKDGVVQQQQPFARMKRMLRRSGMLRVQTSSRDEIQKLLLDDCSHYAQGLITSALSVMTAGGRSQLRGSDIAAAARARDGIMLSPRLMLANARRDNIRRRRQRLNKAARAAAATEATK